MPRPDGFLERSVLAATWVAAAAALAMLAHVMADVAGRTLLGRPLSGTAEIVTAWYMVAVVCLPWAQLASNDGHLKAELVTRLLPARPRACLDAAMRLCVALYLGLLAWQSGAVAVRHTVRGEVQQAGTLYLPVWPARWLLPVAAGLAAACLLLALARRARRAPDAGGAPPTPPRRAAARSMAGAVGHAGRP